MSKVVLLSFYGTAENPRNISPAGNTVMDYLILSLEKSGRSVEVISAAQNNERAPAVCEKKSSGTKIHFLPSYGDWSNLFSRAFKSLRRRWNLFRTLLKTLKDGDTLLVYHSFVYMRIVKRIQKLRKINLIVMVNEIYADVLGDSNLKKKEMRFFKAADSYIFSTSLLNEAINHEKKPASILNGTYHAEDPRENCKFEGDLLQEKKHIVYAGTFDPRKGGAAAAAAAAGFLPVDHHIHIIGFGDEKQKKLLQEKVEEVAKLGKATVTIDGQFSGEEYIRFLQSCHVGLSTQLPDAAFNATSFPSKVLSYLANGLRVVSVRIPAVETSTVGDMIYYYDQNDPKAIAEAIREIDWEAPYDSRRRIRELDAQFTQELLRLIDKKNPEEDRSVAS